MCCLSNKRDITSSVLLVLSLCVMLIRIANLQDGNRQAYVVLCVLHKQSKTGDTTSTSRFRCIHIVSPVVCGDVPVLSGLLIDE